MPRKKEEEENENRKWKKMIEKVKEERIGKGKD